MLLLADDRVASLAYFMLSCHKKNADAAALHMHKDKTKKVARLQLFGHAATATVAVTPAATVVARHPLTHPRFACVSMRSVEPQSNEAP